MPPLKFERIREEVRERLFTVGSEDYVGNELEELGDPFSEMPAITGEEVFLFPFVTILLFRSTGVSSEN
jgi:hypothetical protein